MRYCPHPQPISLWERGEESVPHESDICYISSYIMFFYFPEFKPTTPMIISAIDKNLTGEIDS